MNGQAITVTTPGHPGTMLASQYGFVRLDQWCELEANRMNAVSRTSVHSVQKKGTGEVCVVRQVNINGKEAK
jgi:hypothetical protein